MQYTVDRDVFLKALAQATGVLQSRVTIPILSHVLIGAEGEGGYVRGSDLEIEVFVPFEAQHKESGSVAVPGRVVHDIVKRMPAGKEIGVTLLDGKLKLVCGRSRFELATMEAADYPIMTLVEDKTWTFEIEAETLRATLAGVRHAISTDETRYYLNGVYLHLADGALRDRVKAISTDGHMLALQSFTAPPQSKGLPGIIIPRKTVGEFLRLLPATSEMVDLSISTRLIRLEMEGGRHMTSKLIDGTFPDYHRVIPADNPFEAKVSVDDLRACVGRVAAVCDSDHVGIRLQIGQEGSDRIVVSARNDKIGSEGSDEVQAEVRGSAADIGVNCRYLLSILDSIAGGELVIQYNSAADPLLLTLAGNDGGLGVLMPMRI